MYKELYKNIIDKARKEKRMKNQGTYYEQHHIVPDFLYKNRKEQFQKDIWMVIRMVQKI